MPAAGYGSLLALRRPRDASSTPACSARLARHAVGADARAFAPLQERGRKDLGLRLHSLVPLLRDLERLQRESYGKPPITAPLHPVQTLLDEARAGCVACGGGGCGTRLRTP